VAVETAVHPNGVSEISGRILFEGPDYAGEEFSSLHEWTSLDDDGWANGRWWGEKLTPPKQPAAC
jgi:hypothetical protein